MNISYKWLKRYIGVDNEPRELAAVLTSTGLECDTVEEVESIRGGLRGIVVGKVLTCEAHPDSDHLHVTTVDVGSGEPLQIVCGAPNVAAGQTVVVATIGTVLYDGDKEFRIKKSKMRGVESFGMICAEDEIGVGTDHAGIMVLPDDVQAGTPAAEYFNLSSDYCMEVELTPNRVDAASHYGVARDLKARQWCELAQGEGNPEYPEISLPDVSAFKVDRQDGAVKVRVEDAQGAPRYSGVTIRGVKVAESPQWLKDLLTAVGQRPINNVVDVTNFVLLGIGQPLHCFDLSKVKDEEIVVRTCPAGTKFTTLDGEERELNEADLMICDAEKPLCIAGVFGGLDSGVTGTTTDVFLESAWFNATRVRRTARRHGLSTDASFRYERGTDPAITVYAARLAALLIQELAGGEVCGDVVDICANPVKPVELEFSLDYCNRLIGSAIPRQLVITILRALEFGVAETADPDVLHLTVPTYRVDVTRPCDVVEEVLRIYGYNSITIPENANVSLSQPGDTDLSNALQQTVSEQLTAQGFNEIMNNSLSSINYYTGLEQMCEARCVKVLNPLSSELSVMRQTLLFGGLESLAHNINRRARNLRFYEFGNVYSRNPEKESTAERPLAPYSERMELALWMTGNRNDASWNMPAVENTVYEMRGVVDGILRRLGVDPAGLKAVQGDDEIFSVKINLLDRTGRCMAALGLVRRKLLAQFGIEQPVVYAMMDWKTLFAAARSNTVTFSELPRTQGVDRDLALLVDRSVKFADIEDAVRKAGGKLLRDVRLFDVYEGDKLPAGKKSYAISMTLQDNEKTLNDKQIDAVMSKIVKSVTAATGAELR
ncbi:MAG: phenylalanine--tRNA ligase subunit beta [Bacteroidales bacterium]|nr:phenylalanine--tRNA ligase subunit beta [Bacteroidales bacterium]